MPYVTEEKGLLAGQFAARKDRLPAGSRNLRQQRELALASFESVGYPTARNEDWRFTRVMPIIDTPFDLVVPRITITGNVEKLSEVAQHRPQEIDGYLGKIADFEREAFTALNTALWQEGVVIRIPDGKIIEVPIVLEFHSGDNDAPQASFPRVLVIAGKNSQATVVERHSGTGGRYLTNTVTEIALAENAALDHYKVQEEAPDAFHVGSTHVRQERSSNFRSHYVSLGAKLVRNEIRITFNGEGCEATLNGLYLGGDSQHVDNFTVIDHAKPHCASHELYKGILTDKAHGVFNGKIFVRQDAQKTDAKQTNQVLLLSDDAVINTKPQLEIFADDVKCTHGATIGQLDEDALFYLRSRGIGLEAARNLLIYAFANDILERLKIELLRDRLADLLTSRHLTLNDATGK